jgi:hypothetical protein
MEGTFSPDRSRGGAQAELRTSPADHTGTLVERSWVRECLNHSAAPDHVIDREQEEMNTDRMALQFLTPTSNDVRVPNVKITVSPSAVPGPALLVQSSA